MTSDAVDAGRFEEGQRAGRLHGVYSERRSTLLPATVWRKVVAAGDGPSTVLPDGCMDVIWHDGHLFVAGADTVAHPGGGGAPAGSTYVGLRFDPGVAPLVLGVPAHSLTDEDAPLGSLWSRPAVDELAERMAAGDPGALEEVAAQRLAEAGGRPAWTAHAAARLAHGAPVAAVADELGVGERQLHRRALAAFGYGPKVLARILRFQRAADQVRAGRPLATVAAEAGYADQAHLARDVKRLAGVTPTQLATG